MLDSSKFCDMYEIVVFFQNASTKRISPDCVYMYGFWVVCTARIPMRTFPFDTNEKASNFGWFMGGIVLWLRWPNVGYFWPPISSVGIGKGILLLLRIRENLDISSTTYKYSPHIVKVVIERPLKHCLVQYYSGEMAVDILEEENDPRLKVR